MNLFKNVLANFGDFIFVEFAVLGRFYLVTGIGQRASVDLRTSGTRERPVCPQGLPRHEQRQITYLEMSFLRAERDRKVDCGHGRMTMTFYDKAGSEMLVEQIS